MLDLFSLVMFSNYSRFLQTMYLQFIRNLNSPLAYSWASMVLACLYRGLYNTVESNNDKDLRATHIITDVGVNLISLG
jgi:hypothetical protein